MCHVRLTLTHQMRFKQADRIASGCVWLVVTLQSVLAGTRARKHMPCTKDTRFILGKKHWVRLAAAK
jgi:hypothetical protein